MLFDLRSRGRRRTVQVIYIGLAILIGGGLILFGVGTGGSGGGLLGGLTGGGSKNAASSAVDSATRSAIAATNRNPHSAAAWSNLINARQSAANSSAGYDSTTETYTTVGKQQLTLLLAAYDHYTALVKTPSANAVTLAARAETQLGNYSQAASTYQTLLASQPGSIHALQCVAFTSSAAGNTRVSTLAADRLKAKLPKTTAKELTAVLAEIKTKPAYVAGYC